MSATPVHVLISCLDTWYLGTVFWWVTICPFPGCSPDFCVFIQFIADVWFVEFNGCTYQQFLLGECSLEWAGMWNQSKSLMILNPSDLLSTTRTVTLTEFMLFMFSSPIPRPWTCSLAVSLFTSFLLQARHTDLFTRKQKQPESTNAVHYFTFITQSVLWGEKTGADALSPSLFPWHPAAKWPSPWQWKKKTCVVLCDFHTWLVRFPADRYGQSLA